MKILILSSNRLMVGGVVNYTNLLIRYFEGSQYQIKHFTQGRSLTAWKNWFLPFLIISQLINFKKTIKEYNPDIIHINPSLEINAIVRDSFFLLIAKINRIPTIFFVRGWNNSISNYFYVHSLITNFFRWLFSMPDTIIVLAEEFKIKLENLGIASNKIRVETTMTDASNFISKRIFPNQPYRLLFCSRIEKNKGIYQLLYSIPLILRKYPKTQLTYMGDGSELDSLKLKISEMNLSDSVTCIGSKIDEHKIEAYTNSDIFVFPTFHSEGFPNVFCEAMVAGLPVVATPNAGLADALQNYKQGVVIRKIPPSSREIALRIIQLLRKPGLVRKISKNNLREGREKYDIKIVCDRIGNIYKETAGILALQEV